MDPETAFVTMASGLNCSSGTNSSSSSDSGLGGTLLDRNRAASSQGHRDILQSHANSATNAMLYIGIVLVIYILAVCFIGFRYLLTKSQRKLLFTPYYFSKSAPKSESRAETASVGTPPSGPSTSLRGGRALHHQEHHRGGQRAGDTEAFVFSDGLVETEL